MGQLSLPAEPAGSFLTCRLTPGGRIELRPDPGGGGPALASATVRRIGAAFDGGRGAGVLHLGVAELSTDLPVTLGYWRDVGRAFVARVCGALDPLDPASITIPEPDPGELASLAQSAPPMRGAELLSPAMLAGLWNDLGAALTAEVAARAGGLQAYLAEHSAVWNVVGRVCFHLAENKGDPELPFAFMATYVDRVSRQARPRHLPLGQALEQYAGARNRTKLLALLAPLQRAAAESGFVRELVDAGDVYHPLAWTPDEAHRFLCEVPLYERAGLVVRTPDWWNPRRRPRPRVTVTVGGKPPSTLGTDALLDFDVRLTLEGDELGKRDLEQMLAAGHGLVLIKGRWVEVDAGKLTALLERWSDVEARARAEGISLGEAMRMLAGADPGPAAAAMAGEAPDWSDVVAGKWLAGRLEALRSPRVRARIEANAGLAAELRPYQKRGVAWMTTLRDLGLGGCLADDMGLGKTIQVLGLLSMSRGGGTDLLVVPASLLDNWRQEIERFAPRLKVLVAHGSHLPPAELKALPATRVDACDAVITTYGTVMRTEWMRQRSWRHVIVDEAQAIKNPGARQTRAIKSLRADWRLALTGTPVENRLGDLWSIFDFLNPGLLGSATAFNRSCKTMAASEQGYAPLRKLLGPYILRRLKTDRAIIADLPDKTEVNAYCHLGKRQAALYQQAVDELREALRDRAGIERRGVVLAFLLRFKQICNHPSQWLGDGDYDAGDSGKLARLRELADAIAARQDKLLVFTQFREMTGPLADFLTDAFGDRGLILHGGTPVKKRQHLVEQFQTDDRVPFMVLSLKAGGTGLNLTAASHVIHFDRWWNPAVENQATDRAFRIGQKNNVLVHKFVCRGTVEERIDRLIATKQELSDQLLTGGAESALTEMDDDELLSMVSLDLKTALGE